MPVFNLIVNGKKRAVQAPADMPLLWVLRDILRLTGTKYGCGLGVCGICTLHLDGKPVKSCLLPVREATGRRITTIEGLSENGDHAVQVAWAEADVPQCGYCQSGQIMQAAALLSAKRRPSDQDIDTAMSAVLCRCGTYPRIKKAIESAAKKS